MTQSRLLSGLTQRLLCLSFPSSVAESVHLYPGSLSFVVLLNNQPGDLDGQIGMIYAFIIATGGKSKDLGSYSQA